MQPVGLAQKRKRNKYSLQIGELMLIHICEDCGQLSSNRIAADDRAEEIWIVFKSSGILSSCGCLDFQDTSVNLLNQNHADLVSRCLFGFDRPVEVIPDLEEGTCLDRLILTD